MKRNFTLIELFVVVFIVGIVAAILYPVFLQSKSNNSRISCLSNMRQLGLGMMMYAQDYDERFPPSERWMTVLDPYVKNKRPFVCPIVKRENPKAMSSAAMDVRLSMIEIGKITDPKKHSLAYESSRTDWNAADPGQTFTTRHNNQTMGSLAYADGHARSVTKDEFQLAAGPLSVQPTRVGTPEKPSTIATK
jgi:prepilin-type processing-associated H-X9-DG protein